MDDKTKKEQIKKVSLVSTQGWKEELTDRQTVSFSLMSRTRKVKKVSGCTSFTLLPFSLGAMIRIDQGTDEQY